MFHRHIKFIINVIFSLIILLYFSHKAYACNADSLIVEPSNLADANTPLTFSISGCEPRRRINVSILDSNDDVINTAAWEFYASEEGTLTRTLQNFMPREGINYPFTAKLSIILLGNDFINISREFTVNSGYRGRPQCGDNVPPNSLECPNTCLSVWDPATDLWFCGGPTPIPTPTPTPRITCAIRALVGFKPGWERNDQEVYAISTWIESQNLPAGTYRFHIYNGVPGPGGDYITRDINLSPNTTIPLIIANNLDRGYNGQTHTLTLEATHCNYADTRCIYCETNITFPRYGSNVTPTTIDPDNAHSTPQPLPPTPTLLPDYRLMVDKCGANQTGVLTAIGCIPANMSDLFATFLRIAIGIAGGLAFLLIIFGGLRIILSSGHPEGMMEGKEIVTSAIVGLLVIIFSVFLLRFIGVDVLKLPGFSAEQERTATPTPMSSPTPQ